MGGSGRPGGARRLRAGGGGEGVGTACESPAWELRRCCLGCRGGGGGGRPRRCSSWQRGKAAHSPAYFQTRASVSRVGREGGREVLKITPERSRGGQGGNAIPCWEGLGRGGCPGQSQAPGGSSALRWGGGGQKARELVAVPSPDRHPGVGMRSPPGWSPCAP